MEATLRNERGFALAVITALLPLLAGAILTAWALTAFIQVDLRMKWSCRNGGLRGQEQVAPLLRSLLAMNPLALQLRAKLIEARAEAASGHPIALAHLAQVELSVRAFELKQQQLVRQSNLLLYQAHSSTRISLSHESLALAHAIPLFEGDFQTHWRTPPQLAVRPDSPDHPPTYSPTPSFSEKQALVQSWQYRMNISKPLQTFLKGRFQFENGCAVTLKQESSQWSPQIIAVSPRDRF